MKDINRKRIRATLIAIGVCCALGIVVMAIGGPIIALRWKLVNGSPTYHAQLADACATVVRTHPLGTNAYVRLSSKQLGHLPRSLRELHVSRVTIEPGRAVLGFGGSVEFWIDWHEASDKEWHLEFVDGKGKRTPLHARQDPEGANKVLDATSL